MSQTEAKSSSPAQATEDAVGRGEATAALGSTEDRTPAAEEPAEKVLLCTLCGLRACWT